MLRGGFPFDRRHRAPAPPGVNARAWAPARTRIIAGAVAAAAVSAAGAAGAAEAAVQPPLTAINPGAVVHPPAAASTPITPPAAPPPEGEADNAARFTLNAATFDGAHALDAASLEPAWAGERGKQVSLADLRRIARQAEQLYARHGYPYVAVVVPPQRVEGGVVHFKVVEGRVADVAILSRDRAARRQISLLFAPLVDKTPLAAADVESAYERAAAIPGLAINGALRRGEQEGDMDLVIQASREAWRPYVNVNNLYPDVVGPWGVVVGVDHFGASPFGDTTSLQGYASIDGGSQWVIQGSHQQTLNAAGTTVSVMALGASANPGRSVAPLSLAARIFAAQVGVSQPIALRLNSSLSIAGAFEIDNQKTDVFSSTELTSDHLRILSFSLTGEHRFGGGAFVGGSLEIRQGVDVFGGSRRGDASLSRAGADPEATVVRLGLQGQTPAFGPVRLYARLQGQGASAPLTEPEQYDAGDLAIGRGYQPGVAFGDEALAGAFELRFGPLKPDRRFTLQPFLFCDLVALRSLTPGFQTNQTLASAGGGVRVDGPGWLHLELTYAQPLEAPLGFGGRTPHPQLLLNATVGLNKVFDALHGAVARGVKP